MPERTYRSWCFTIKGHDDDVIERLRGIAAQRIIVGREIGDSGYQHLQGYVRFLNPVRLSWWKNQFPIAHVEVRRGTEHQASTYCAKGGDVVIDQGVDCDEKLMRMNRNDEAEQIIAEIEAGATYGQIRERHKFFCFWHRRCVLEYLRDTKFMNENYGADPIY